MLKNVCVPTWLSDYNGFWGEHIGSPLQAPNFVGVDLCVNP
jgi:hypothetical protein